jgi:hypothetical protein
MAINNYKHYKNPYPDTLKIEIIRKKQGMYIEGISLYYRDEPLPIKTLLPYV